MVDRLSHHKGRNSRGEKRLRRPTAFWGRRRIALFRIDKLSYRLYFWLFEHRFHGTHIPPNVDNNRILVLAPHQDDETLGCGGFLLSCRGKAEVQPIFVTSGKGWAWLRSEQQRNRRAEVRVSEAKNVCRALGTREPINLGFEQSQLPNSKALIEQLSVEIKCFKPTVIMAPFFTDANPDHLWTTKGLARVSKDLCARTKILLYRAHAQIPKRFQNMYFGLTESVDREKERILSLYKSQRLDVGLTSAKYLLYSRLLPRDLKGQFRSIERYCCLSFSDFVEIDQKYGNDVYLNKIRSLNYAPYSFRCYVLNELVFRVSPFCRKGADIVGASHAFGHGEH